MNQPTPSGVGGEVRVPWVGAPRPPRRWQRDALPLVIDALKRRKKPLTVAVMGAGKAAEIAELCWLALPRSTGRAIVVIVPSVNLVEQLSETIAERCGAETVGMYYTHAKQADRPIVICCLASLGSLRAALDRPTALLLIDEAHKSFPPPIMAEIDALGAPAIAGFTATPYRSAKSERLVLFDEIAYRYEMLEAVRDGALVPPDVWEWRGSASATLDQKCLAMIGEAVKEGQGVVFCASIAAAEARAELLTSAGVPTLAIHNRVPRKERKRRLAALKAGEIQAVTQVNMLVEGVDFPWLRWLCLWDPILASVKFLQGAGRVLRAHPGKTCGIIVDPHCCFGRFGWVTPEAIGAALQEAADAEERDRSAPTYEADEEQGVALLDLVRYLGAAQAQLVYAGIIETPKFAPGGWHMAGVTHGQVDQIRKSTRLTRHIPPEYREGIRPLVRVPWALTRGQASVLLDILLGGARWAREEARRLEQAGGVEVEWFRLQWPADAIELPPFDGEAVKEIRLWGDRIDRMEKKMGIRRAK